MKRGVLHVEPPRDVLEAMRVVRIHLDDVTLANGPLWLRENGRESPVLGPAGGAMAYPFLTEHRSSPSTGAASRRTLHFEVAPAGLERGRFRWHCFDSI